MILALLLAPQLSWGYGTTELSPAEALPLGGYTARQGRVGEAGSLPLLARTLLLRKGGETVALCSVDMLTIPESLYEEVSRRIGEEIQLFLVATHTHSAPDSQMLNRRMNFSVPGIASFRERWLDWYADRIAKGILATQTANVTATVRLEERRLRANKGRRPGASPDTLASRISVKGDHLLFHYSAHATVLDSNNNRTDPDWPGLVRDWGLFLPGPIGDVAPATDTVSEMRKLLRTPVQYYETTVPVSAKNSFGYSEKSIQLHPVQAHPDFAKSNKIPEALAQTLVRKFAPPSAKVSALRIGKIALVGIPGEPTSSIGRSIRDYGRRRGFASVLVTSHVNGWMGYILDVEDYRRGGYEASLSFYGETVGLQVIESAKAALDNLAGK